MHPVTWSSKINKKPSKLMHFYNVFGQNVIPKLKAFFLPIARPVSPDCYLYPGTAYFPSRQHTVHLATTFNSCTENTIVFRGLWFVCGKSNRYKSEHFSTHKKGSWQPVLTNVVYLTKCSKKIENIM